MNDTKITIKKVMLIAHLMTLVSFLIILLSLSISLIYIVISWEKYWMIPIAIVISIVITLIVFLRLSITWRIWAFTNVDDRHKLREVAKEYIGKNGRLISKLDFINSKESIKKLQEIEDWFYFNKLKIIFKDDLSVPDEIEINYIKQESIKDYYTLLLGIVLIVLYFTFSQEIILFLIGLFYLFLGLIVTIKIIKRKQILLRNSPVLKLNNDGIFCSLSGFIKWNNIEYASIDIEGNKKIFYVYFINEKNKKKGYLFMMSELSIKEEILTHYIEIYKGRFRNK